MTDTEDIYISKSKLLYLDELRKSNLGRCACCDNVKPINEFGPQVKYRKYYCLVCMSKLNREYYLKNKKAIYEKQQIRYHKKHWEKITRVKKIKIPKPPKEKAKRGRPRVIPTPKVTNPLIFHFDN